MLFKGQLYTESEKHMLIRRWTLSNKNLRSNSSQTGYVTTVNAYPSQNLSNLNLNFIQKIFLFEFEEKTIILKVSEKQYLRCHEISVLPVSFIDLRGLGSVSA